MSLKNLNSLHAFLAVARERSFTRATATLGVSQSTGSSYWKNALVCDCLRGRPRSVTPTNAGDYLICNIGSHFGQIETQIVFWDQYGISRVA